MEMSGQPNAPAALTPGKEPLLLFFIAGCLGLTGVDILEGRKMSFSCRISNLASFTPFLILGLPVTHQKKKVHYPLNDHEKGGISAKKGS